jgi:predicted Rossmann-fold nucleotide-binding protein
MKIGFIGFSAQKFDEEKARNIIRKSMMFLDLNYEVVSGATNMGIPKLVYEEAKRKGMKTIGIIPKEGMNYELFPQLDQLIVEGENWGEESERFLFMIDSLVMIGGGEQPKKEYKRAQEMGIPCRSYPLHPLKD